MKEDHNKALTLGVREASNTLRTHVRSLLLSGPERKKYAFVIGGSPVASLLESEVCRSWRAWRERTQL